MPERFSWRAVAAGAVGAAGLAAAIGRGEATAAVVLAAAFALGHLFPLRFGGGRLQPVGPAVATAAVLSHLLVPLLWGAAMGVPLGWVAARLRFGERQAADLVPGEAAGLAGFVGVFALLEAPVAHRSGPWGQLAVLVAAMVAWYLASAAARAAWTGTRRRLSGGLLWRTALSEWPVYLVLVAAGSLYGLTAPALGAWAVLLAGLPYGFAHLAFGRLAASDLTYRQTIRVLGKVPEAGGLSPPGHAERSAEVAVALTGELGMRAQASRRVEQAAFLADIGRVAMAGVMPTPGRVVTTADLARWSAAIVAAAPTLEPVAALVAQSSHPYRRPGEERDPGVSPAAQVVKVATAYDYAVGGGMEPGDALEILHQGSAYEYDPAVLAALRRVLRRRGVAGV